MKEVIVRLTSDHIKVKGAEYVQDLVRCKDCALTMDDTYYCEYHEHNVMPDDFCSYGEVRDE